MVTEFPRVVFPPSRPEFVPKLLVLALLARKVGWDLTLEELLPGTLPVALGSTMPGNCLFPWAQFR